MLQRCSEFGSAGKNRAEVPFLQMSTFKASPSMEKSSGEDEPSAAGKMIACDSARSQNTKAHQAQLHAFSHVS